MSRRALIGVLVVSLAVNLFAVGAVAGAFVLGPRLHEARFMQQRRPPFWTAAERLSPERRAAYRRAIMSEADEVRASIKAARRARREAWLSLREPGFTPAAAAARLERARQLDMQARSAVERRILDYAATLPADERAALAEGLARSGGRRSGPPPGRP